MRRVVVVALALVVIAGPLAPSASSLDRSFPVFDRNHDGRADPVVLRPIGHAYSWIWATAGGATTIQWGDPFGSDYPIGADFDGDGRTDEGVIRTGIPDAWLIRLSSTGALFSRQWGSANLHDVPVLGDFDGDGRTDIAVMRPASGADRWIISLSGGGVIDTSWGDDAKGDDAVAADYDGDGRADIAVRRANANHDTQWFIRQPTGGTRIVLFGKDTDQYVPGDFDGDGRADITVTRTVGDHLTWFTLFADGSSRAVDWGRVLGLDQSVNDGVVLGDFDGDGRDDIGVWRPDSSVAHFLIRRSSNGTLLDVPWGQSGDISLYLYQLILVNGY